MNRIDKLLIQARDAVRGGLELTHGLITHSGHSWMAEAYLCDGIPGHAPTVKRATYAAVGAAVAFIHAVANEYPNSKDVPVIVDDI